VAGLRPSSYKPNWRALINKDGKAAGPMKLARKGVQDVEHVFD
jgi:hypothetical protein